MYFEWRPYVSVAQRRLQARKKMDSLRKKGVDIQPIEIQGRAIARTFWGKAWCDHLESFSDYANRLPRGRTYVRNGSVCHLAISKGKIEAKVSGSELYNLRVQIKPLDKKKWDGLKRRCAGQIGSLIELLQGTLSDHVMGVVTDREDGLFPKPGEIDLNCDCPDWAVMCKHVAAVLYGVGARLDDRPELLFTLRGVNHEELIDTNAEAAVGAATRSGKSKRLAAAGLADVFGIDLDGQDQPDGQTRHESETNSVSRRTAPKRLAAKTPRSVKARVQEAAEVARKTAVEKPKAPKKAAKKKTPPTRTASWKESTRKTVEKTPAKKKAAKKPPVKKTPVKKTPVKKTPVKKTPVKNTPVKKAPVKKTPVKKTPAKKAPTKKTRKAVKKRPAKKTAG